MGDWADMYDYSYEQREKIAHTDIRNLCWITRNGEDVRIGSMTDKHLLNAYKISGDEVLFKELVVRLFEKRLEE